MFRSLKADHSQGANVPFALLLVCLVVVPRHNLIVHELVFNTCNCVYIVPSIVYPGPINRVQCFRADTSKYLSCEYIFF
jgi:hypothetical protein